MSMETLRQYIGRLPSRPEPERSLHRVGPDRVAGSLGNLRLTSVFQPVARRDGVVFGHQAFARLSTPAGETQAPRAVLDGFIGEEAVRFDRLCRTVHALNRFAGAAQWAPLFLVVENGLLRHVADEHGSTFQRILSGFGILASRVVITLPAVAGAVPGLVENVLPSYRLRNFQVALDVTDWPRESAPRIARLRPDFVRLRWTEGAAHWVSAAHEVGARLVATHLERAEQEEAALRAGADLLQGYRIGRPSASLADAVRSDAEEAR